MYKAQQSTAHYLGQGREGTTELSTQMSANIDNEDSSSVNALILLYAASLMGFKLIVSL